MENEFLGVGWRFPIQLNQRGGIAVTRYEEKVRESIKIILSTAKGERVMRPTFGCDIQDFVFSVMNTTNLTMIKSAVEDALIRWEPRIDVLGIETSMKRLDEGILEIEVNYRIRSTNTEFNLVYPFYLKVGA